MEKSFENILNALLEEYERNPQEDINSLAQIVADQNGFITDVDKLTQTYDIIDEFDKSYNDLINEKGKIGISAEAWMRNNIVKKAAETDFNDEDQARVLEIVAEAIEINNSETIENID